jgi:UDP-N-acetylmuramoyl-tripeptide--D-alanyl-D-alanine ligase
LATPIPANRARFTVAEIAAATGASAVDVAPGTALEGVSTDSRTVERGALFVALRGETHDGHAFVGAARERGALPLVAAAAGVDGARLETADPLAALGRLARFHVDRLAAARGALPTLAIGGAAGKTTTKTLAAAAVEALYGATLVTAGNLNNRIGVPMTLLTLDAGHRAAVVECGTSEPGEIAALGAIVRPDVALVLNVGIEHSEKLGGVEAIADEEAALFAAARVAAVTASDEALLRARLAGLAPAVRRLLFGSGAECDVRLRSREVQVDGTTALRFAVASSLAEDGPAVVAVRSRLVGPAAADNVAAALAGALASLGRPATAGELAAAAAALGRVEPVAGRLAPSSVGDLLVLDDSYNSNPRSLRAALAATAELAASRDGGPPVLALGDMLELGELEAEEHDAALAAAAALAPRHLVLVGPRFAAAARRVAPAVRPVLFDDSTSAADAIAELVAGADLLLVKGSRGTRMERLLAGLASAAGRPGPG